MVDASVEKVGVVGLGYVGLPLALLADEKGFDVVGLEVSKKKLAMLKQRRNTIDSPRTNTQLQHTNVRFTDNPKQLSDRSVVVICVPTPVDKNKAPDLTLVINAVRSSIQYMKAGTLLIIESTINPGVCDEVIIPLIEAETDHIVGKTLHIAHCPERINPGDSTWHVGNINRVLGAQSKTGLELARKFYGQLIDAEIKTMGNIKEAEAVKVVENSFRDINIAFVNELAMSFHELGINVYNVIDGAATKPFAFMPHYPGIGVGGHCIPVDPYYLIEYAKNNGFEHKFLKLARTINEAMPAYSADLLEKTLIETTRKTLSGATIAILGLSYKANVGDDRESPSYAVIKSLEQRGATVISYDPYMLERSDAASLKEALHNKDAVIIAAAHDAFLKLKPSDFTGTAVVLDGRNALYKIAADLRKAGITYVGIGA